MYEICIDSEQFSGKRLIQQHRMINEVCEIIYSSTSLSGQTIIIPCHCKYYTKLHGEGRKVEFFKIVFDKPYNH